MHQNESRINELKAALAKAEQRLADRETLLSAAVSQTEAARSQYEQVTERLEALRRRLDAKEQQVAALQKELEQRDARVSALEQLCSESDNALNAINQDVRLQNLASRNEDLAAMGLVLESLEGDVLHRIGRATTTIGRAAGNDVLINSTSVSRYHARLVVASDSIYLVDLQSTNGSSVNGQRISRRVINSGDVIAIGDAKFRFASGVPMREGEDRSFDETHTLLDDSVIFSPAPGLPLSSSRKQGAPHKTKTK